MSALPSIRVKPETHARMSRVAEQNRMPIVEAADAMSIGWEMLTPEQRRAAIEHDADAAQPAAPSPAREKQS